MKTGAPVLVVFDMDGTLTRHDTLLPFLLLLVGPVPLLRAALRRAPVLVAAALGRADRGMAKGKVLADLLAGRREDDVQRVATDFAASGRWSWRSEVVALLRWHQEQGHELAVISAGLGVYVKPLVARLGVEDVAATGLEAEGGLLTGQLVGHNVRGPEKVRRLRELLGERELRLVAYGDSAGDRALLAAVDHAVWCGRRPPRHAAHLHLPGPDGSLVLDALADRLSDVLPDAVP